MKNRRKKPVVLRHVLDDSYKFKTLPHPSGSYPYRMDIMEVMGGKRQLAESRMSFHMVGDTGSARSSAFQSIIASQLAGQATEKGTDTDELPAFLYHLGDIVYNYGEAREYPNQFFKPFAAYPAPIFAIPGNHDADINPDSELVYQSLDAFMDVFCDSYRRNVMFAGRNKWLSMNQPNVYWTLQTPLANFIGLYANVTKFGTIDQEQRKWFAGELRHAHEEFPQRAIIVCVHHAPYSADTNHGSSRPMITFLEQSFQDAGVIPDAVFSGHVHNYQRFSKTYPDGTAVPYIVAGAGGYADLHRLAYTGHPLVQDDIEAFNDVRLENYCDNRFGFLKMTIEKTVEGLQLLGEYYTILPEAIENPDLEPVLFERFHIPLRHREYVLY